MTSFFLRVSHKVWHFVCCLFAKISYLGIIAYYYPFSTTMISILLKKYVRVEIFYSDAFFLVDNFSDNMSLGWLRTILISHPSEGPPYRHSRHASLFYRKTLWNGCISRTPNDNNFEVGKSFPMPTTNFKSCMAKCMHIAYTINFETDWALLLACPYFVSNVVPKPFDSFFQESLYVVQQKPKAL